MKKYIFYVCMVMGIAYCIDNSSLHKNTLGKHYKTYGVVYLVPKDVSDKILAYSGGVLKEKFLTYGIFDAINRFNIPHITVLHIHTKDVSLPEKILKNLPSPPKPFSLNLKGFALVKASQHSKMPWWFEINVEHTLGYQSIMQYNEIATKALTPLRDSPLPRVSGNVYADLSTQAQQQIRDLGVNGLNRVINGNKEWLYRPHMTLSYSMQELNLALESDLQSLASELNKDFTQGVKVKFDTISIVELGISGNVLREIYRINLNNGKIIKISDTLQNN